MKQFGDDFIIKMLYVDDMLLIGNNNKMINVMKFLLTQQFYMKYLGLSNYTLVMKIRRDR